MLCTVITLWSKKKTKQKTRLTFCSIHVKSQIELMFENYRGQSFFVIFTEPKSDWLSISGVLHLGYNNGSRVLTLLAETGAEDRV